MFEKGQIYHYLKEADSKARGCWFICGTGRWGEGCLTIVGRAEEMAIIQKRVMLSIENALLVAFAPSEVFATVRRLTCYLLL